MSLMETCAPHAIRPKACLNVLKLVQPAFWLINSTKPAVLNWRELCPLQAACHV